MLVKISATETNKNNENIQKNVNFFFEFTSAKFNLMLPFWSGSFASKISKKK